MRRRLLILACLAAPSLLAVAVLPGAQGSTNARAGGIFRVSFQGSSSLQAFDHVDPALAYTRESWALLDTVCARLMRYRDRPPPAGYRIVPEVAARLPKVSRDGRTTTFTLRSGFRFSDGRPVRANAFAQAINRTMARGVESPAYRYTKAIVGAEDVRAGRTAAATGVVARGNTLVVRFTREVRDFAAWTTMPFFCAVPPTLPPKAEGVRAFPGAGPYYISEYRPNERIILRTNRYYGGQREHHVAGFEVDLSANSPQEVLDRIEHGKADWGYSPSAPFFEPRRGLIRKYGIDYHRFQVRSGLTVWMYLFNSSRPLFKNNAPLRQAVNLALNRAACQILGAEAVVDQLVPPLVPGFRERRIYPLEGDLEGAKALANGHVRDRKLVLYAPASPLKVGISQTLQLQLAELGLEVEIREIPEHVTNSAYRGRLGNAAEPWDMALILWTPDFVDSYGYVNGLLDARSPGGTNLARFDEQRYLDLMHGAARRQGAARGRAYANLDLQLARDAAPVVPMGVLNEATLVSARVPQECMLLRPGLVLTTVCLKR